MQLGCALLTAQPPQYQSQQIIPQALEEARIAEDLGFDAVWNFEHHFTKYGLSPSSMLMSAFILGQTQRIKVGTAVTNVPLEHPLKLAERVALLDQLAPGRFLFGIGRGAFPKEFDIFGVDMARNHEMFEQSVDIMMRAWQGPVESTSGFYQFYETEIQPPLVSGLPTVYVAARSPSSIQFAAKWGFPLLLGDEDDGWEFRRSQLDVYAETAIDHGHDPTRIRHVVALGVIVSESQEEAEQEMKDQWIWWTKEAQSTYSSAKTADRELPNYEFHRRRREDRLLKGQGVPERAETVLNWNPVGTPERCIERLQKTIDVLETDHFLLGFEAAIGLDRTRRNMELFMTEVAPHLKPLPDVD